jgi:hypothetical protein
MMLGADAVPVAYWGFGQEEASQLISHGGVHRDIPGPRPELYPDFSPANTAVHLDGKGARFTFADPGANSPFDFTNGDEITMEAWVKVDQMDSGDNVYVIGKGRTGNRKVDNQNWALRLSKLKDNICISFLFSSEPTKSAAAASDENWHRWISSQGFRPGKEWHHIAIAYSFGDPNSIRGVIDGHHVEGVWDAGGATSKKPTVDDDEIWIGSALGGAATNSFRGDLDEIAIYRQALSLSELQARYRGPNQTLTVKRLPETMPDLGTLPAGLVQISLHEGMPAHFRWLNEGEEVPGEAVKWNSQTFLLDHIPQKYEAWGIRDSWKGPALMRMAGDITLPPGKHRFLMRVRGLSRLWIDGKIVAQGKPMKASQDGFEPMTPPAKPPKPGLRIAKYHQQEIAGEYLVGPNGTCRVVLETLVGGKDFRVDPGELCVAVETTDGQSYVLLQPGGKQKHHLTDETVVSLLALQTRELQHLNDQRRRTAEKSMDTFWDKRHQLAQEWNTQHPAPSIPEEYRQLHPVDAFLSQKTQQALSAAAESTPEEAEWFHQKVLPILREQCFRCHGDKSQGGLRLDSIKAALAGGDSGMPAVHPGDSTKSELVNRIRSQSTDDRMPPGETGLNQEQMTLLEDWINRGAHWPSIPVTAEMVTFRPIVSDEAFVRRVFLDTVGVIPTADEVRQFSHDQSSGKRIQLIDRLLSDDRWADHWTSYWLDVLAENPTLLNASLNSTGPFRWFVYDSFRDNKPFDRFVTELILLRGSAYEGGSAGFGVAANNDAPFATKGQIIGSAFLGIELQCARCHDSPYHSTTQQDLYSLAAMFEKKNVTVPKSNSVPAAFFENQQRESLIQVTLKPGVPVSPVWPFAELTGSLDDDALSQLMQNKTDVREKLAALVTSHYNHRFAEVIVNRVWRRLIGSGIVEPADDWEGKTPSHPELLAWLAHDFIDHGYNLKHLTRQILTSQLYQRESVHVPLNISPDKQFFVAPNRRRISSEQVVDSLCVAVGKALDVEEMTFAPEGGTRSEYRQNLGVPSRAWNFASLGNERDRPSLSLPRARAVADIMEAFGWSGARQNPRTDREVTPNLLQPGILQNSDAVVLYTRASWGSGLAEVGVQAESPEQLVETLFLKILSRYPRKDELAELTPVIANGFDTRLLSKHEQQEIATLEPLPVVTWSNHVQPEANTIAVTMEQRAKAGIPPDPRLRAEWREAYEDVVWSLVNLSEFVWMP